MPTPRYFALIARSMVLSVWVVWVTACTMAPATPAPDVSLTCSDALGCVELASDEPVVVAAMLVLSGPNTALGKDQLNAIEIAVADYGLLHGHEIVVKQEDSECSAEGGQTAARKVVADPTIVGVLGTSCSSAATAALPVITDAGMSMISASTTSPTLTNADRDTGGIWQPGFYRTSHNDRILGEMVAFFAFDRLGARTMATIHDGSAYAEKNQAMTAEAFAALEGSVVHQGAVNVGDQDMRPLLIQVAASQPDVLVLPVFQPEGNLIVVQAREIADLENTALIGGNALYSEDFLPNTGQAALGMYMTGPRITNTQYDAFLQKYRDRHGGEPISGYHAHMYDATIMLLEAITAAAQADASGYMLIGRQAIRDYLNGIQDFPGITGSLACGPTGDCATGEVLAVHQINDLDVWPPEVVYQP